MHESIGADLNEQITCRRFDIIVDIVIGIRDGIVDSRDLDSELFGGKFAESNLGKSCQDGKGGNLHGVLHFEKDSRNCSLILVFVSGDSETVWHIKKSGEGLGHLYTTCSDIPTTSSSIAGLGRVEGLASQRE